MANISVLSNTLATTFGGRRPYNFNFTTVVNDRIASFYDPKASWILTFPVIVYARKKGSVQLHAPQS